MREVKILIIYFILRYFIEINVDDRDYYSHYYFLVYYQNIIIAIIIVLLLRPTHTIIIAALYLKCNKLRAELVMQSNLHVVLSSLNDSSRDHTCFIDLTMTHL